MEILGTPVWLLILVVLAGGVAQLIDGAVGMGFGALSATIMVALGVNPAVAVGTVVLAKVGSGVVSAASHWGFGNVNTRWLVPLTISGVIGGVIGAFLLTNLPDQVARVWVPVMLLAMGLLILNRSWKTRGPIIEGGSQDLTDPTPRDFSATLKSAYKRVPVAARMSVLGTMAGGLNGLSGAYGPLATPAIMLAEGGHPRYAIGTVNVAEFFVSIVVSATIVLQLGGGSFEWEYPGALIIGSILTAPLGAYLARKLPRQFLGVSVGVALVGLNIWVLIKAFV
ncbi:MAG: sulfite exporter TauE/SafE family protein [Chloroflexi bacterium]|nr:sulfite exporter TauE/SafE family protein [Chloroflexota bacterium]